MNQGFFARYYANGSGEYSTQSPDCSEILVTLTQAVVIEAHVSKLKIIELFPLTRE